MAMKSKWLLITLVLLILTITFCMSVVSAANSPANVDTDAWTSFRHNLTHTGTNSAVESTNSSMLLWKYTTNSSVLSSPAIENRCVYFGSKDNYIYCLNASSGNIVWSFGPAGGEVDSSPAIYSGRIFVGADDGFVYCLDAATGQPYWIKWIAGFIHSSPAVADGCVYIGS